MGVKTTVATTALTANHMTATTKAGLDSASLTKGIQETISDLITQINQVIKTMPNGDANLATYQALLTALA